MSWWSMLPILLVALAIFIVPGAIVAYLSSLRGFALIAVSPAVSISLISIAAVIASWAGGSWSIAAVILLTAVAGVIVHVLTRWLPHHNRARQRPRWKRLQLSAEIVAVLLAFVLIGRRLKEVFGRPDAISQTFDNVFHLNAVQYILDTDNASSLILGAMTGGAFYPAAWHDIVSLLVSITGAQIPTAVIAVNLCIGAVVWPLGCIFLTQRILGRRVLPTVIAAVLSAGFGAFPILMMDYGVLYPYALAISLLPSALALAVGAVGQGSKDGAASSTDWILLAAALPGLTLSHPSVLMTLLLLLAPVAVGLWWRSALSALHRGDSKTRMATLSLLVLGAGAAVAVVLWKLIRPAAEAAAWPPVETTGRAIGELLSVSQIGQPVSLILSIFAMTGLVISIARRQRLWLVGMYVVLGLMFVIAASFPVGGVRSFFTGVWYNDSPRLAALLPTVTLPLAVIGCMFLVGAASRWVLALTPGLLQPKGGRKFWVRFSGGGLIVVIIALSTQQSNVRMAEHNASGAYRISTKSALLSLDELELIRRLRDHVPADVTIASNPWNGSALAFALADRKTLQLHLISEISPDARKINQHLRDAKVDPNVCPAVRALNVEYVLDFGHNEVHGADHGYYGLDGIDGSGVGRLIDSEGDAKLLKIEACT